MASSEQSFLPTLKRRPNSLWDRLASVKLDERWLFNGPGIGALRAIVDFVTLMLAVGAVLVVSKIAGTPDDSQTFLYVFPFLAVIILKMRGTYRFSLRPQILEGLGAVIGAISVTAMLFVAGIEFLDGNNGSQLIAQVWLFALVYVCVGRVVVGFIQSTARMRGAVNTPTLIIGAGQVGLHVARRITERTEFGLKIVGFLDSDPPSRAAVEKQSVPLLGNTEDLTKAIQETGAKHLLLAFSRIPDKELLEVIRDCQSNGIEVSVVPRLYEYINGRVHLEHLGGLPLLELQYLDPKGWQFSVKYVLDRLMAAIVLTLMAIPMGILAVIVRLSSPGPIFFRQQRIGCDGRAFELLKFRTMKVSKLEGREYQLKEGCAPGGIEGLDRRTWIGQWMRKYSVDELPQLINILRGDMSLIGPRPERPNFVQLFKQDIEHYDDRHRVRSGITGWAQVHGLRGQTSLADRVEWDNFYIENWSLWLDFKIFLMTFSAIWKGGE